MRRQWHPLFSDILKITLEPKGYKVESEAEVGNLPLTIDVVVIKKEKMPR